MFGFGKNILHEIEKKLSSNIDENPFPFKDFQRKVSGKLEKLDLCFIVCNSIMKFQKKSVKMFLTSWYRWEQKHRWKQHWNVDYELCWKGEKLGLVIYYRWELKTSLFFEEKLSQELCCSSFWNWAGCARQGNNTIVQNSQIICFESFGQSTVSETWEEDENPNFGLVANIIRVSLTVLTVFWLWIVVDI